MAQRRTCSLLALLTLFLAAGVAAQPILIEDVGPDGEDFPGAPAQGYRSPAGLIAAVDGSGPESVAGPPTSWSSRNGSEWVEHVAAVDSRGHLKVFYRQPRQEWKVVDVTEKTGTSVAVEQPAAWLMPEGGETDEKLAVASPSGELLVFRWRAGSDWQVENLTEARGHRVLGAVSAWVSSAGGRATEYVAARGTASQLLVFYRPSGGAWKFVDVTSQTGGGQGSMALAGPTAWTVGGVGYVAASSPQSRLLLFAFDPFDQGWTVESITAAAHTPGGSIPWVQGRVEAWTVSGQPRLAARGLDGALLVFTRDAIESRWSFEDVSATAGPSIASAPTFWESGSDGGRIEHLAAVDSDGHLVVFYRGSGPWRAVDVESVTGRTVRHRPTSWVTPESAPPLENVASTSPDGNLVVFSWRPGRDWIAENASRLASGRVLYAASQKAGVWRSDDYGRFWRQTSRSRPGGGAGLQGTLDVPVVLDVAVSPVDPRIVLVGTGSDHRTRSRAGLYRSTDGGTSWQRVASFTKDSEVLPVTGVTFASDDPDLAFAVGGSGIDMSTDGGGSWQPLLRPAGNRVVWHVAVSEADAVGRRSLAALGPTDLWFAPRFDPNRSSPLTADWVRDDTAVFGAGLPATTSGSTGGTSSHVMTFVPGSRARVLVADQAARGQSAPRYYGRKRNGDKLPNGTTTPLEGLGSLWDVDLSRFDVRRGTLDSTWDAVPLPAIYTDAGSSGVTYVYAHRTAESYLVFFSNENTVHVAEGVASATKDWHRLDGLDASQSKGGNRSLVHPDPHDLLVSASFELDLGASGAQPPFDQHASLGRCGGGRLWMANDGGVVHSADCGGKWEVAEDGLDTVNFINVAVSPRKSGDDVQPYVAPYLYGGTTHTDQSFSPDGGATWTETDTGCGDCDAWFSDPAQPSHVLALMPRDSEFHLYVESRGGPDASRGPTERVPYPDYARAFAISFKVMEGYRPIVYSMPGEANLPGGDYVTLMVEGQTVGGTLVPGGRVLLRARDTFTSQSGAAVWQAVSGRAGVRSVLPKTADVVQAAGGHQDTVFFVGDGQRLWRSHRDPAGTIDDWELLVPNAGPGLDPGLVAGQALRFFVNPYDPQEVYLVGADAVRHTTDGGATWPMDHALDDALTESGSVLRRRRTGSTGGSSNPRNPTTWNVARYGLGLLPGESENLADELVLNDMVFDRDSSRRFAVGLAGVFFSQDGKTWRTLIDSRAIPGRPRSAWFDAVSDPADQSLYVAYHGRSILKVHPIPPSSSVSWAEIQPGTMEVVPPPVAQAEVQPGTMEVVSPLAARCERYAEEAVALVQRGRELGCGFSGPRWSESHSLHRDWCVRQQTATLDGEARARESQLVECTRRLEGSQATAKAPERLEMMEAYPMAAPSAYPQAQIEPGTMEVVEPIGERCERYADEAVAAAQRARGLGCGLSGPRWSENRSLHRDWCVRQQVATIIGEARAREDQLVECKRRLEGSQATAKPPDRLEMMQGQLTIAGSRATECELYAITAVAQERQNRERGCRFVGPGWNPDGRAHRVWCERQSPDVLAAVTKTRGIDLEQCLAGRETAVGRNDRCTTYAATAVLHAQLNQQRGCGQAGPRWSTDFLLHYHWCERQSATVPEAEAAERRRQLTRCGVPVGQ